MLLDLLDVVLPRRCLGCGVRGPAVCGSCLPVLHGSPRRVAPTPPPPGLPPVLAVTVYDGVVRAMLIQHKERGRLDLGRPLGEALARAAAPHSPAVLVPVPSWRAARRARGYDHCARLARFACRELPGQVTVANLLRRVGRTSDQSLLSSAQRQANLTGGVRARPLDAAGLHGARVVLVDDIMTTGASLAECARALRSVGVEPVGAAVVAATSKRLPATRRAI